MQRRRSKHTCLLSQVTRCARARKRRRLAIGAASGVFQRQRGLACLRGGGGEERDSRQVSEGNSDGNGGSTPTTAPNKQDSRRQRLFFVRSRGVRQGKRGEGERLVALLWSPSAQRQPGKHRPEVLQRAAQRQNCKVEPHSFVAITEADHATTIAGEHGTNHSHLHRSLPCQTTEDVAESPETHRRSDGGDRQGGRKAGGCAARAGVAVRGGLANTFLPGFFPASVRPEYVRYRCWDIVQPHGGHQHGGLALLAGAILETEPHEEDPREEDAAESHANLTDDGRAAYRS